ncbi:MAG TPA: metallophosphoesterase [Labilithrix sp.]|nr:metallophosphoesterase [Labilithrix sp.]
MRRIAHLSDVHILDRRTRHARYRFITKLVSLGRRLDPEARKRRLARALQAAKDGGADHIVISGDLTEVGEDVEFEQFAEVLHDAKLPADSITLVPGNHDAYTSGEAWTRALAGPLEPFAAASASTAGKVVDRGTVAFLPIDTTIFQTIALSRGVFTKETAAAVERRIADPAIRNKAMVLVVHHPPFHPVKMMARVDGLDGDAVMLALLARYPHVQVLHGHLHGIFDHRLTTSTADGSAVELTPSGPHAGPKRTTHAVEGLSAPPEPPTRLFGAGAVCDGPDETPRIRLYDVKDRELKPVALPVQAA